MDKLKPLLIVKPGTVSRKDINRAEQHGGICIIECMEPGEARFMEPPLQANMDSQSRAAMQLLRVVLNGRPDHVLGRGDLIKVFVDALMNEHPPKAVPPPESVKGAK